MGELVSIESLQGRLDPCSKFIREFLNDIYLGKVRSQKTAAHDHPEAANRHVHSEVSEPPRFCILKGFKLIVSVVIYVDDEIYSRHVAKKAEEKFEQYARKAGLWKDMSAPNFEGELVSHLGRKSAEKAAMKSQISFLREKVAKLEQERKDWIDWVDLPRASLHGKSISEWARKDNIALKRPAKRTSEAVTKKKQEKQSM